MDMCTYIIKYHRNKISTRTSLCVCVGVCASDMCLHVFCNITKKIINLQRDSNML